MTRYRKNPSTAGRIVDGCAFVVTPQDNRLHTLNGAATLLWQLSSEGITDEEAAEALISRFEVARETALADASECLSDLVDRQILVVE